MKSISRSKNRSTYTLRKNTNQSASRNPYSISNWLLYQSVDLFFQFNFSDEKGDVVLFTLMKELTPSIFIMRRISDDVDRLKPYTQDNNEPEQCQSHRDNTKKILLVPLHLTEKHTGPISVENIKSSDDKHGQPSIDPISKRRVFYRTRPIINIHTARWVCTAQLIIFVVLLRMEKWWLWPNQRLHQYHRYSLTPKHNTWIFAAAYTE